MNKKIFSMLIMVGLMCFFSTKSNALIDINIRFFSDKLCEICISISKEKNTSHLTWIKDISIESNLQLTALKRIDKSEISNKFYNYYKIADIIKEIHELNFKKEAMLRGQEKFIEKKYNQLCSFVETKEKVLNTILINYMGLKQQLSFNC